MNIPKFIKVKIWMMELRLLMKLRGRLSSEWGTATSSFIFQEK